MPANTRPAGTSGRTWIGAYFITASSLLTQWGGTLLPTEPGRCRQLTVRRSKRKALLTIRASRAAASPAKLVLDLTEGSCSKWAVTGGTWGASAITITDALTVDLQQHPAQWTSRHRQVTYRPQPASQPPLPGRGPSVRPGRGPHGLPTMVACRA